MKRFKRYGHLLIASAGVALPVMAFSAEAQKNLKPYPLKTCVVSGEKLGSMGEPYVHAHKDREIKFCCKGCLKDFNKDTTKYLKQLEEAEQKQKK